MKIIVLLFLALVIYPFLSHSYDDKQLIRFKVIKICKNCDLTNANLYKEDLNDSIISNTDFSSSNLKKVNFERSDEKRVNNRRKVHDHQPRNWKVQE